MLGLRYDEVFLNSLSKMCPSSRLILNQSYSYKTLNTLADFSQLLRGHILGTICDREIHNTRYC